MHYINTQKQELSPAYTCKHTLLDEISVIDRHQCHMAATFGLFVDDDHSNLSLLRYTD